MKKSNDTVRYTAEQLGVMRQRGESRTDWAKVDAMTEAELDASTAADPDHVHETPDWSQAILACRRERSTSISGSTPTCWLGSGEPVGAIRPV
jgi:hypothetical protein